MFCFGLQSIARFINTNASYLNTHRLESEGRFSINFQISVGKKNKRSFRLGRNCALGLKYRPRPTASGSTQELGHSFSQNGPPSR